MKKPFSFFTFFLYGVLQIQSQVLKISLHKGQKFAVESSTEMTSSGFIGDSSGMTSITHISSLYEVDDIDKDKIEFKFTINHISMYTKIMGEEIKFDSNNEEDKKNMKEVGKTKKISINMNGYVIKEEVPEKIDNSFMNMFSDIGRTVELLNPSLIGKELSVGLSFPCNDSLTKENSGTTFTFSKDNIGMKDSGNYTVTKIQNGIAYVTYDGVTILSMITNSSKSPMVGNISGTKNCELMIDMKTGIILSNKIVEDDNIKMGATDKITDSKNSLSSFSSRSTMTTKVTMIQ